MIVKERKLEEANRIFAETNIQISIEGERHLGAIIGTEQNKKNYINSKIGEWGEEIKFLSDIATTYPQAAYTAYVSSYQHKLTYYLRTIPGIDRKLNKIDEIVRHKLIPAITGGHIINDEERKML